MFDYCVSLHYRVPQRNQHSTIVSFSYSLYIFSFYTNTEQYGPANAYKFSAGLKQVFPSEVSRINLDQYQMHELTIQREDYFPIVISIESIFPQSHQGKVKKNIQFTYGTFTDEDGTFKFKYYQQKLLVRLYFWRYLIIQLNKTIFELNDIFGIDNNTANISDETQKECVICYTSVKDTVVLPCRHLSLCQPCS